MAEDLIRYDILAQEALRGVVRKVLNEVARTGLPGEHHFFINFVTRAPGVRLSQRLLEQYDKEMTIVLQNQFANLRVHDNGFEVDLSFDGRPETLFIPFSALKGFYDPSVQFGLQFDVERIPADEGAETVAKPTPMGPRAVDNGKPAEAAKPAAERPAAEKPATDATAQDKPAADKPGEKVVSLDSFRKK